MNNILSYIQYREKVRLYESMIIQQEMKSLNEGIVDKIKERISSNHVDKVLKDEIELGKQVEEKIKNTMSELEKICDSLNIKGDKGSDFKKSLSKLIEEINKTSFDTLSLLGDSSIDFIGFKKSAVMANVINLSVILSPIKNSLMLRRAYKYFVGLIKQSLRRDLVMLLVNFDQFQNDIMLQSLETDDSVSRRNEVESARTQMETLYTQAVREVMNKKHQNKTMDAIMKVFKMKKDELDSMKRNKENNPVYDFIRNGINNNTYKQSADTLKQLIGEDNQKMLESYKNSIQKIASTDKEGKLGIYGEFLISAAEEKAMKTVVAIHTNFLKISEVFKLSNQKKLVEMMQESEEEYQKEIENKEKERKEKETEEFNKELADWIRSEGEKILKLVKSFDDFDNLDGEMEGPNNFKLHKKELLIRYLQNESSIPDYLKVVIPFSKYDSNYNECYLSYLDILVEKVWKMFGSDDKMKDCFISYEEMEDETGKKKIQNKFFKKSGSSIKVKKNVKNALKYISDDVVKFDYTLLLDKMKDVEEEESKGNTPMSKINSKSYKELHDAIEYMKKYIDNDYTKPDKEEKKE